MKRNVSLISIILLISLLVNVQASSYTFAQDNYVNYHFICVDQNNHYCSNGTQVLFSIEDPDGHNMITNQSSSFNPTFFNYSLPTNISGSGYTVIIVSPNGNATSEFTYDVTPSGTELSTAQGIIYIILLFISLVIFIFLVLGGFSVKWENSTNLWNEVTNTNPAKYLKILFFFLSYILLIWILYLGYAVSNRFLFLDFASTIMQVAYLSLIGLLIPLFVITGIIVMISMVYDAQLQKMIRRNLSPR